jgi:Tfp pilus assembly protein PilF
MTRWAKVGPVMGLAGLLLTQAGCMGTGWNAPLAWTNSVASSSGTLRPNEMPTNQTLQASLDLAQKLEKGGNEADAAKQYESVLKQEANNLQAMRRLAVLYDNSCEFSKADEMYRKVAKALPKDPDLYNDWGYSYYMRTKFDEAETKLRRALVLDPNHQRARCNLGLALGQMGRLDDAKKAFQDAHLSEAEVHCNLAFIHLCRAEKNKDTLAAARREAQLAVQQDPYCNQAKLLLAQMDNPSKTPADVLAGRLDGKPPAACDAAGCRPSAAPPPAPAKAPLVRTGGVPKGMADDTPPPVQQVLHRSNNGTAWVPPVYPKDPAPVPLPVSSPVPLPVSSMAPKAPPVAPPAASSKPGGSEGTVLFDE